MYFILIVLFPFNFVEDISFVLSFRLKNKTNLLPVNEKNNHHKLEFIFAIASVVIIELWLVLTNEQRQSAIVWKQIKGDSVMDHKCAL